jgi:hypothetical protein
LRVLVVRRFSKRLALHKCCLLRLYLSGCKCWSEKAESVWCRRWSNGRAYWTVKLRVILRNPSWFFARWLVVSSQDCSQSTCNQLSIH